MGSVVQEDDRCPCCGKDTLFYEYFYNTGEEISICRSCDYVHTHLYKRDIQGGFIPQVDFYILDGTVGYSSLRCSDGELKLNDYTPLSANITNEEFKTLDRIPGKYLIKLDPTKPKEFIYLSFWFDRTIVIKDGCHYVRHGHPIVEDIIIQGKVIEC